MKRLVATAIKFVDDFDEKGFGLAEAALQRRFPDQNTFVMGGLTAKTGSAALVDVGHFLDRLDQLESGEGREPETRKADLAAIALLETDGLPTQQIDRREQLHEASTKLRRMVSPTAWLFSGWN